MRPTFLLVAVLLAGCQLFAGFAEPTVQEVGELNDPEIGVRYRFTVYTHCGLDTATIDGETWLFDGEPDANPPPGFGNPMDTGTIVLLDEDHAVYTSSAGVPIQLIRGGRPRNEGACL